MTFIEIITVVAVATMMAGVSNAKPPNKIIGGVAADPGEYPYQVSLRVRGIHHCGGAIISNRHIITAAHCVYGYTPAHFLIATGSLFADGGELHTVRKIVYHPMYVDDDAESPNDIAIMTLTVDMMFNENQNKIDLPDEPTPGNVTAIATGWGYTNAEADDINRVLLKVGLRTMFRRECQRVFGRNSVIYRSQVCTDTSTGLGTCRADSGGPLAYIDQLVGIVSYGVPCARGVPDVYTSVYHFVDWIRQNMRDDEFFLPPYLYRHFNPFHILMR